LIPFSGVERVSEEPDKSGFFVVLEPEAHPLPRSLKPNQLVRPEHGIEGCSMKRQWGGNPDQRQVQFFAFTNRALLTPFVKKLNVPEPETTRSRLPAYSSPCRWRAL
jgi:hypothetical protein